MSYIATDRQVYRLGRGETPEEAIADHAAALDYYRRHLTVQRWRLRESRRRHLALLEAGGIAAQVTRVA